MLAIHVTHEASRKYGGIGSVLAGLIPSETFSQVFDQNLLYGPLFDRTGPVESRIENSGRVLYSGLDGYDAGGFEDKFRDIQARHGVHLIYGKRELFDPLQPDQKLEVDVVLVDVSDMLPDWAGEFKYNLWEKFGLHSENYQIWDYEQYVRIAAPYLDIIEALYPGRPAVHFSHEYMGLPSALSLVIARDKGLRTEDKAFFYAHEVAPARAVVENSSGHEVSFDNLLRLAQGNGHRLEDDFGSQAHNYRSELVKRVDQLDGILAVGDNVRDQMLYLQPEVDPEKIHLVYNGISFKPLTWKKIQSNKKIIADYCETLFNFRPDYIFSHITRLVISKGLWRDVQLLYRLDERMAEAGKKGFYILISTLAAGGRDPAEIERMEKDYGWPIIHQEGWPDLDGAENDVFMNLSLFNARSRAIKGVFLNQFGFSNQTSGKRVPEEADLLTLRSAADVEFGLSTYEPFGIAQLETFPYGGLPILSRACGCSYLVENAAPLDCSLIIDYAEQPKNSPVNLSDPDTLKGLSIEQRTALEETLADQYAPDLFERIYPDQRKDHFLRMSKAAPNMSWEVIAQKVINAVNGGQEIKK